MKKTILTFVALALFGALAMAQDKPTAPAKPATPAPAAAKAEADPIIVAAGDVTIRQSEFENALKTLPAEYQQFAQGAGKRQFADDYLRMKMLAAEGTKAGLDKDPEVLRQLGLMRENLIANAQLTKLEKGIVVSDDDLKKAYEANKKVYETNQHEQVKARHILIAFKGSPAAQSGKKELTEDEAKAKAEDLRKQLVGGASFEELAKKESDDVGSGSRGGDLGAFGHGQMVPEFEKAAFETKAGEISAVIRTQYGYHIIKVDSHDTTPFEPFEQVKANLEQTERQKLLQAKLDEMKTKLNPTYNTAYFGEAPKPEPTPAPQPEVKKE